MYNDLHSLGDRAKESRESEGRHAGTGEGISARIHVANSHADRAEGGCRSDCRHSADSLWERDDSDSWSLSHLGYLYPGTTPVMLKLDHYKCCPRVNSPGD